MMRRPWTSIVLAMLGAALFLRPSPGWSQDRPYAEVSNVPGGTSDSNLVFTPVLPCRVADTRVEGGRLIAGVPRDYDVAGVLGGQGGSANCMVPFGPVTAVVLNFVAVAPLGPGNLRAWPFGQGAPTASIINYTAGVNIANGVVVSICDPAAETCTKDLTVRADASDAHLVVDVLGYFAAPPPPAALGWSAITGKPAGFADDVDNDTTYTASNGVNLVGTSFSADSNFVQKRVTGSCAAGSSIRAIDSAGLVICEFDTDTTYTSHNGVTQVGTTFSADTNFVQRRVSGVCAAGSSMRAVNALRKHW